MEKAAIATYFMKEIEIRRNLKKTVLIIIIEGMNYKKHVTAVSKISGRISMCFISRPGFKFVQVFVDSHMDWKTWENGGRFPIWEKLGEFC